MKFGIMAVVLAFHFQIMVADPLLVVVLMVKNEAAVIEETLKPYVEAGVSDFVIFDTGPSTDGTQAVVTNFFTLHALERAFVVEEPFIDFATSRNRALEVAQNLFPDAVFMLMPDAEWYMHNVEGLLRFCREHEHDEYASYLVPIKSDFQAFYTARLIRCHCNIKFVGRIHEVLNEISVIKVPDNVYFEWRPSDKGMEKSKQRWLRDRDWLLESHAEDPYDLRTLLYLAQTYECLEDWENAYQYYQKRTKFKGWDEEDFAARYGLARVAENLGLPGTDGLIPLAIQHYLAAFSLAPHRAEPLVRIASYYRAVGDIPMAFLFASRAAQLPYPSADFLPIERYTYEYVRYDILGICAWYVGEYDLGEWAVLQALKREPKHQHLWNNLKLYSESKLMRASLLAAQA